MLLGDLGEEAGARTCIYITSHIWCVPGRGQAHTPAGRSRAHSCDPFDSRQLPEAFLSSAHQSRCEVKRAGLQQGSLAPADEEPHLPLQRTAPRTSQRPSIQVMSSGLRSACPSDPLCSLGLRAGSSRIHTAGCELHHWNVLPATDRAYLLQQLPPSLLCQLPGAPL